MFVDASAIVAIIDDEEDASTLAAKLAASHQPRTSPLAIWEAVVALVRTGRRSFEVAEGLVSSFLTDFGVQIVSITAETGRLALEASNRFGRGRHPAQLNFGDCFAYASSRQHGAPLLFKGDDFPQTDVVPA